MNLNSIPPSTLLTWSLVLSLLPLAIGCLTSFIKVSLVISMLKSGFGMQGVPGKTVEFALSMGISLVVMSPIISKIDYSLIDVNKIESAKLQTAIMPWLEFLKKNSGERELDFISNLKSRNHNAATSSDLTPDIIIASFVISEINRGFLMGFAVLLPFLVVDLVIANTLIAVGLSMVTPSLVAFPLKVILFVLADGWMMLVKGLILSYE